MVIEAGEAPKLVRAVVARELRELRVPARHHDALIAAAWRRYASLDAAQRATVQDPPAYVARIARNLLAERERPTEPVRVPEAARTAAMVNALAASARERQEREARRSPARASGPPCPGCQQPTEAGRCVTRGCRHLLQLVIRPAGGTATA